MIAFVEGVLVEKQPGRAALVVAFFKVAIGQKIQGVLDLLLFGLAILAASGALLVNRGKGDK